jgi:hypothetical protein
MNNILKTSKRTYYRFCHSHYCEPSNVTRWQSQWCEIHKLEFLELPE